MIMEMRDYALEGIAKLRGIAITEIVFGCLAVAGVCAKLSFIASDVGEITVAAILVLAAVLLLATGSYGVDIIRRSRAGKLISPGCFRTLAILNIILCVLYCIHLAAWIILTSIVFSYSYGSCTSSGCITDITTLAFMGIMLLINLFYIGITVAAAVMAFRIRRHSVAILNSCGMTTKAVEGVAEYPASLPYTRMCTEVRSSDEDLV